MRYARGLAVLRRSWGAIGIDESGARAGIGSYERGMHELPLPRIRLIADAVGVPLIYLYCEDDQVAKLLLRLERLTPNARAVHADKFLAAIN